MKYIMPAGMRYSTLRERRTFYKDELQLNKLSTWMAPRKAEDTVYACIIGRNTGIYPKKYSKIASDTVLFKDLVNYGELRKNLLEYLPEGAYYDRNIYKDRLKCAGCKDLSRCFRCNNFLGQELAFDLDPENVDCPIHGTLSDKMKRHQGLGFCEYEFSTVREKTIELYELLSKKFEDMRIVYSGRGFHIHVLDKEAYSMKYAERKTLAGRLKEKDFPLDEWVSSGNTRLIRLPYSLHGMVSRICLPLKPKEVERFDPVKNKQAVPKFFTSSLR